MGYCSIYFVETPRVRFRAIAALEIFVFSGLRVFVVFVVWGTSGLLAAAYGGTQSQA